ncbi:MAG: hypothetical protein IPI81_02035 [Flavobacteriales bacterium]|nr:hypothetical protein [Flavobacteriales bacterium]MCC6939902.1 hypothetical protein [Flavobacteriales bacterium]
MYRSRIIPLIALALFAGCGGGSNSDQPTDEATNLVIGGNENVVASLYQMPTPNELFGLVRDMAGEGHKRMLSPASQVDKYVSRRARAINFGVYATDLVYASSFKLNVEVARYYLTTKKLADELGINAAFTDADFVRLESNLTRGDSLEVISNQAYQRAYEKMQQESMGPVLSMVLAGGWLESMHLVMRQIDAFGKNEALTARVAEQKVTLEHLISMMTELKDDPDVAPVYTELVSLRDIYDQLNVVRAPHQGASSSGRMVLGDDITVEMTDAKYEDLKQAVSRLRAAWTKPEDQTNS